MGTTQSVNSVTYSSGGDIAAISGQTATNTKGTTSIASTSTSLPVNAVSVAVASNGWFDIFTNTQTNNNSPLLTTSPLKAGDSISYKVGYKVFASSTSTAPTASASGSGKFTIVDEASNINLSAGIVVAAIAILAF